MLLKELHNLVGLLFLFRVMEAITANLVPTSIIMLLVIISASVLHMNHMFPWMAEGTFDPSSENYDAIVDGKSWWINVTGWTIRGIIYLGLMECLIDGLSERILLQKTQQTMVIKLTREITMHL